MNVNFFSPERNSAAVLPRLIIRDDDQVLAEALARVVSFSFSAKVATSDFQCLSLIESFDPHIVLVGLSSTSEQNGLGLVSAIREQRPNIPVVVHSLDPDTRTVETSLMHRASAHLSRRDSLQRLVDQLQRILRGVDASLEGANESDGRTLTERQTQVLNLIASGCSAKEIANNLNISVRTAEFHRAAIMTRLGLRSTAQMTRYAVAQGIG